MFDRRITVDEGLLAEFGLGRTRRACERARPVGGVLFAELRGEVDEAAAGAQGDAGVAGNLVLLAIASRVLAVARIQAAATPPPC